MNRSTQVQQGQRPPLCPCLSILSIDRRDLSIFGPWVWIDRRTHDEKMTIMVMRTTAAARLEGDSASYPLAISASRLYIMLVTSSPSHPPTYTHTTTGVPGVGYCCCASVTSVSVAAEPSLEAKGLEAYVHTTAVLQSIGSGCCHYDGVPGRASRPSWAARRQQQELRLDGAWSPPQRPRLITLPAAPARRRGRPSGAMRVGGAAPVARAGAAAAAARAGEVRAWRRRCRCWTCCTSESDGGSGRGRALLFDVSV